MQLLPCHLIHSHKDNLTLDGTLFTVAPHSLDILSSLAFRKCVLSSVLIHPFKFWQLCYKVLICPDLNCTTFQILCSEFCHLNIKKLDEKEVIGAPHN